MMALARVMVVEDDGDTRETVRDLLELVLDDVEIRVVPDGRAAQETAADWHPHVALIDYRLPGGDGLWVADELCQARPGLHCILMTADPRLPEIEREADPACLHHFLTKPLDPTALAEAVRGCLGGDACSVGGQ